MGLEATTALYGTMLRASEPLGRSQAEAARATETFGKALKLGGAGAAEASSATLQFSQALASGVLRGDEFNSIAEASPRIMQLLADSLGVTRGELRGMAEDGKLSADVLFNALTDRKFTDGIDAEFRTLPTTFGESMTLIEDAAIKTFGAFDRGGQFSTMLVNFVTGGTDGFATLEGRAEQMGIEIRASLEGLRSAFAPMEMGADASISAITGKFRGLRGEISDILGLIDSIRNFDVGAQRLKIEARNSLKRGGVLMGEQEQLPAWFDSRGAFERGARRSAARGRVDAAMRRLEAQGYVVPRDANGLPIESGIRRAARPTTRPRVAATSSGGKSGGSSRKGGSSKSTDWGDQVDRIRDSLFPNEGEKRRLEDELAQLGKALAAKALPQAEYDRLAASIREKIAAVGQDDRLIDKIMPEQAEVRRLGEELAALDRQLANGMVKDQSVWRAARDRVSGEYGKAVLEARRALEDPTGVFANLPTGISDKVLDEWAKQVPGLKDKNDELRDSFADMARDVSYSLRGLADDLRNGDWLDVITGALDLGVSLASAGAFGKGAQARFSASRLPGMASGGSIMVGGNRGIDRNVLSINGSPVARVNYGERIDVSPANARGAPAVVQLVVGEGQMFEPRVTGISGNVTTQFVTRNQRTQALRGRQGL